ncbi:GNAT family N-acetyltransferase [Phaeobacter gallaeciensis]|uniref:GNAT family N-acetyltransferase n=2 Tax=Roseobacteraceae TaxID=2854170 RepID=A0A366WPF6_9RHOB|nr:MULTISPECIES: N-acetyltransferase [Roseobacteraceae]MBT3141508.1 GNAT family N-acetyltransferase [Falsiruegeria litorea]MBT8167350.1 GNAT family N-acetyltransferase [Falsiruegeria litorea]RBW51047.1 GNAT family N-acetyltransferase [Phaeobacter gallaeciensis]
MQLRPATLSDAPGLAALSIEVWLGTYIKDGVTPFFASYALDAFTAERFTKVLQDPGEHILVSERGQGIDGFVRITQNKPAPVPGCSDIEISTLYVQPRHHGHGTGLALLDAGLRICATLGAKSPWLTTNSENAQALGFYRAQGFETIGQTHFRIEDQAYLNDVLTRKLTLS